VYLFIGHKMDLLKEIISKYVKMNGIK